MSTKEKLTNLIQEVTDKIIKDMEAGVMPWEKTWFFVPSANGSSKRTYQGMNLLFLGYERQQKNYSSPVWMTFLQAKTLGGRIKKGAEGTEIIYFEMKLKQNTTEAEADEKNRKDAFPFVRLHHVFNLDQIEGLDHLKDQITPNRVVNNEEADRIILESGAKIIYDQLKNEAFYSPATDTITLPFKEAFKSTEGFYETACHELIHWTGGPARINRISKAAFGSEEYAAEELVAEFGASILCAHVGIPYKTNHAAYIASWIKKLKDDPKALSTAITQAQKAVDFLLKAVPAETVKEVA